MSYTLVTVAVVLALEIAGLSALVFHVSRPAFFIPLVEQMAAQFATQAQPFVVYEPSDLAALEAWLQETFPPEFRGSMLLRFRFLPIPDDEKGHAFLRDSDLAVVIGAAGQVMGANVPSALPASREPFADPLAPAASQQLIVQALRGVPATVQLADGIILAAHPIQGKDKTVIGAVYLRLGSLSFIISGAFLPHAFEFIGGSVLVFTLGAAGIGMLFGYFTARGLTRRLHAVTQAVDAWSRGDFTIFVHDPSGDEVGHLTRELNRMTGQLQNLLQTRQELAAIEERNRLARDLHDGVKQQVFASAMQLGTARELFEQDPAAAQIHLAEAEQLVGQAQQELTALIRELRPVALEGKGLAQALREYLADWSRQSDISGEAYFQGERPLPLETEQVVLRVAQEALANVARHSSATAVQVHLAWESDQVTLIVSDNGRGFDTTGAQGKGLGLHSMKERVEALGGNLTVESAPGQSARVIAVIPLAPRKGQGGLA